MHQREYSAEDASSLADLIHSGQVSRQEVEAAARSAIAAVNPAINAVVGNLFDRPLDAAGDGPFAGVPFLVKDLVAHAGGVTHEMGSRLARGLAFPHDSVLMSRFRGAGLAILGRTNTPEMGCNATTEPIANGATRNPWDLSRSPGGSSGGSAALVAAGAVPFAHANDGGGSIRVPAASCGLVGLKPTRGRVAIGPDGDCPIGGMGIEFAVSRTVRDSAALLDAVHGSAPGELFWLAPPARPYRDEIGSPVERLRVAWSVAPPNGVPVHAELIAAVEAVAKLLTEMGHSVRAEDPPVPREALTHAVTTYFAAFAGHGLGQLSAALGRPLNLDTVEATTLALYHHAQRLTASDVMQADANRNAVNRTVGAWFEAVDLLVTPTNAEPAWPLGWMNADDRTLDGPAWLERVFTKVPFTALFNLTGQPAISLPLAESSEGLPLGIQLVARYGREDLLLRVAAALEEAMPWRQRRPRIHVANF